MRKLLLSFLISMSLASEVSLASNGYGYFYCETPTDAISKIWFPIGVILTILGPIGLGISNSHIAQEYNCDTQCADSGCNPLYSTCCNLILNGTTVSLTSCTAQGSPTPSCDKQSPFCLGQSEYILATPQDKGWKEPVQISSGIATGLAVLTWIWASVIWYKSNQG